MAPNGATSTAAAPGADGAGGAKQMRGNVRSGGHGKAPAGADVGAAGDVDADAGEQASEHCPDDVAESPGGFLCDQFSTR
ncbi:hypothetical protein GPECTOR_47g321 [Gonium pectorale]|uniref:Uncharacterized protein n=1 Tax=Gonium pectorale TaxID=33097 RepID=A0A150G856_GONPE|nr:hypothetical protein GPECTOR_47g321 [Gonium pectorale]|eukprot:KXZ46046.1 hypothetical protein GPECTOR_47g321 [Gonium pectorale]